SLKPAESTGYSATSDSVIRPSLFTSTFLNSATHSDALLTFWLAVVSPAITGAATTVQAASSAIIDLLMMFAPLNESVYSILMRSDLGGSDRFRHNLSSTGAEVRILEISVMLAAAII